MDEIPFLSGFRLGNSFVPGCLTADESSRVHSCGPEFMCASVAAENAVFITPVVTRTQDGSEVPKVGAGGGVRDLYQNHELELSDKLAIGQLERRANRRHPSPFSDKRNTSLRLQVKG